MMPAMEVRVQMLAKEVGVEVQGASSETEVRTFPTDDSDNTTHRGIADKGEEENLGFRVRGLTDDKILGFLCREGSLRVRGWGKWWGRI
jgi:hypothetical protein